MSEGKGFIAVYIRASHRHGTLYVGVTSELLFAVQHREGTLGGFTKRYGVKLLVWFEEHTDIASAIHREKLDQEVQKREWKINLIERDNLDWTDLFPALFL